MDAGNHGTRISPENHEDLHKFDSIAMGPHDPNTIYADTYHPGRGHCNGIKKVRAGWPTNWAIRLDVV